eukprot:763916-Hanusia_phi.AAC.2
MTSMLVEGMIRLVCSSLASQLLMMEMLTVAFTECGKKEKESSADVRALPVLSSFLSKVSLSRSSYCRSRLMKLAGKRGSGAFISFLVALVIFALYVVFWVIIHLPRSRPPSHLSLAAALYRVLHLPGADLTCRTPPLICMLCIGVVIIIFMVYWWPGPIYVIKCMHQVKRESFLDPPHRPTPFVMSRKDVRKHLDTFVNTLEDPGLASPENFVMYLMSIQNSTALGKKSGDRCLSWMTQKIAEQELERKFQAMHPSDEE